jgi:hypothetical protein
MTNSTLLRSTEKQLQRFYQENLETFCLDRSREVLLSTKHFSEVSYGEIELKVTKYWSLRELYLIGVLHWYFPEEIRYLVNLLLYEIWTEHDLLEKEIILSSKKNMLGWIHTQDKFNLNEFFGRVISKEHLKKFKRVKVRVNWKLQNERTDKRYSGWCRGPKDKHATSSPDSTRFSKIDYELSVNQRLLWEKEFEINYDSNLERIEEWWSQIT